MMKIRDPKNSPSSVLKVRLIHSLEYIRIAKLRDIKNIHIVVILLIAFAWETGLRKFEVTPGGGANVGIWIWSMNEKNCLFDLFQSFNPNRTDVIVNPVDDVRLQHQCGRRTDFDQAQWSPHTEALAITLDGIWRIGLYLDSLGSWAQHGIWLIPVLQTIPDSNVSTSGRSWLDGRRMPTGSVSCRQNSMLDIIGLTLCRISMVGEDFRRKSQGVFETFAPNDSAVNIEFTNTSSPCCSTTVPPFWWTSKNSQRTHFHLRDWKIRAPSFGNSARGAVFTWIRLGAGVQLDSLAVSVWLSCRSLVSEREAGWAAHGQILSIHTFDLNWL